MTTRWCLLCGAANVRVEKINSSDIQQLWHKNLGIEVVVKLKYLNKQTCSCCGLVQYSPMRLAAGSVDFYNDLAAKEKDLAFPHVKEEFKYIGVRVAEGESVLDVGCGSGAIKAHLRYGVKYVGIDPSIEACNLGKDILCENIYDHADKNPAAYTSVVLSQVLEHVDNPVAFATKAVQALKPGGKLFISVPNGNSYLRYLNNGYLNMPPHHLTMWSRKSLLMLGYQLGLEKEEVFVEPLQDVHKLEYAEAFLYSLGFLRRTPAISRSLFSRTVKMLARRLAAYVPARFLTGHSITIVYRKK